MNMATGLHRIDTRPKHGDSEKPPRIQELPIGTFIMLAEVKANNFLILFYS